MATVSRDGYGQVELNNVAFRRDGRIEAQCALDETSFSAAAPAENGMLLVVDKAAGKIKKYTSALKDLPIALHYSTEHMYDERKVGLKEFALEPGTHYPRMGYLAVGDLFTTNCVSGDDASTYGGVSATGEIALSTTAPTAGPVLKVVKVTTMPDGQKAFKFQVLSC